jgi:hypothetical protein
MYKYETCTPRSSNQNAENDVLNLVSIGAYIDISATKFNNTISSQTFKKNQSKNKTQLYLTHITKNTTKKNFIQPLTKQVWLY